jgi:hypothetical protein
MVSRRFSLSTKDRTCARAVLRPYFFPSSCFLFLSLLFAALDLDRTVRIRDARPENFPGSVRVRSAERKPKPTGDRACLSLPLPHVNLFLFGCSYRSSPSPPPFLACHTLPWGLGQLKPIEFLKLVAFMNNRNGWSELNLLPENSLTDLS